LSIALSALTLVVALWLGRIMARSVATRLALQAHWGGRAAATELNHRRGGQIARTSDFDVALLYVNLGGKRVDPVAEAIRARGNSIVFITGYGKTAASGLVLEKPYDAAALERMLNEALGTRRENAKR
jgi:hypothetical protein